MRAFNQILSNLRESEGNAFGELLRNLLNDSEMFDENMMNDDDDVFSGTEDSYAFEMLEQHLFDSIYYNELFSGLDYDTVVEPFYNEVVDYIAGNNKVTEEWLKGLLDKYKVKY